VTYGNYSRTGPTPVKMPAKAPAPPQANLFASALVIVIAAIAAIAILRISPVSSPWAQGYDPTGHWWLSTILAALPIVVLLGSLALGHVKAHYAALAGLAAALFTAIVGFHMRPASPLRQRFMAPVTASSRSAGSC